MYKLRPFVNLKIMKNVYHALFYSHLVYGIEVWGSACDSHTVPGPLPASSPLFVKLELLKLNDI